MGTYYNPATFYSATTDPATGRRLPGIGFNGSQVATIPFFAASRSDVYLGNPDLPNWKPSVSPLPTGQPVYTYFGCYLDINHASTISVAGYPVAIASLAASQLSLPVSLPQGKQYRVTVRQLTTVAQGGAITAREIRPLQMVRKALGAFQMNVTIQSPKALLMPAERSLAFFGWILSTLEATNRWHPVLQRYVGELEGRVKRLGANPEHIAPSPVGAIPGDPRHGGSPEGPNVNALGPGKLEWTGKIEGLIFDRFGDFGGFILETDAGEKIHFYSRESHVAELARFVWQARIRVSVVSNPHRPYKPGRIVLHSP